MISVQTYLTLKFVFFYLKEMIRCLIEATLIDHVMLCYIIHSLVLSFNETVASRFFLISSSPVWWQSTKVIMTGVSTIVVNYCSQCRRMA